MNCLRPLTRLLWLVSWYVVSGTHIPCAGEAVAPDHAERMERGLELFRTRIQATLEKHCLECHRGDQAKGSFDLSSREALLASGMLGESVADSHLLAVIRHESDPHMPWKRDQLAADEIAAIATWIECGAPYDKPLAGGPTGEGAQRQVTDNDRQFWAFQPLRAAQPRAATNDTWSQTPIDRFIVAKLEEQQLRPQPLADRSILARRAYLDLWGIPPSPTDLQRFLNDKHPNAYERLIERLLADPHYGERWARYWLDVARFAESGGFEHDADRPQAFHYRDFVIRAFNQDLPYDDFVRWQLAGDEIAPHNPLALMATGFLVAGVFPSQLTETEFERTRYDQLDDMIATSGVAFLGMTVGCARCHDHKFDPITSEDYYRFAANFTKTVPAIVDADWSANPGLRPPGDAAACDKLWIASEGLPLISHHANDRGYPHLYAPTYYLRRGDPLQKDHEVAPGFLSVLQHAAQGPKSYEVRRPDNASTSYQRWGLANWLVDPEQGAGHLAARVMVNRLWQHHFGTGLVATPNDFGLQGDRPTHPELLDWLAYELIRHDWHLKPIHEWIMMSSVYQQQSTWQSDGSQRDPENRLLWRYPYRRMDAESLRDSTLAVCDQLDPAMYGPGTLAPQSLRRSIYFTVKRSQMVTSMQLFDMPEPLVSIGARAQTTVAPQALLLLNGTEVRQTCEHLADRLMAVHGSDPHRLMEAAYRQILSRPPRASERSQLLALWENPSDTQQPAQNQTPTILAGLCQLLLSLNEFIYVE